jgi:acid phosphatase
MTSPVPPLRRFTRVAALVAAITLGAGCATAGGLAASSAAVVTNLAEAKRRVAEYVVSGDYERDVAAVVADATAYLGRRLSGGAKLAIVLDIDETALSNLPALRANDFGFILGGPCDLPRGPCGLVAWFQSARAEPIRPVLELARFARQRGVAVVFITGRPERFRAATEKNLAAAGYEWTGVVLKPDDLVTQSASEFKAPERKKLIDQGYTIVVNVGDQQSDLDGGHAERAYKLPNPFYVIP